MSVLLLQLIGPLQAWGTQDKNALRVSDRHPSFSGVVGLICSALGADREDDEILQPLGELKMGVRVDREGGLFTDYQTAGAPLSQSLADSVVQALFPGHSLDPVESKSFRKQTLTASGLRSDEAIVTQRTYLSNAAFLVGLEGDRDLLEQIDIALQNPSRYLFLGRKCCPPSKPLALGVYEGSLAEILGGFPVICARRKGEPFRLIIEAEDGVPVRDIPVSFLRREFRSRLVAQCSFKEGEHVPL